jgi:predicted GTPase/regulator of replication initiation timing
MLFILPFVFGAIGLAVSAVAGAFVAHAGGEEDRQAAKHHRTVANELIEKYTALEKRYYELSDESKKQIYDLTRQHALDEVQKDCLRLAVRLQQKLISLMWDIDREPTELGLKKFVNAVDLTNNILRSLNEDPILVPSDYYVRNLMEAERKKILNSGNPSDNWSIEGLTDNWSIEGFSEDNYFIQNSIQTNQEENSMNYSQNNTSSEKFQETYNKIHDTGTRLLQYLKELRAGRLREGDNTNGLQSVQDGITKTLKALKEQKYQVAVIAAMKAGKSTFINALIGADVLASETEACTVCRTVIKPIELGKTPQLLEYQEGQRQPEKIAEGEAGEIRQKFLERTHEIRKSGNQDNTTHFELEHPIEAINGLSSLAGFTLVDTPGPNEFASASFNTVALKQTTLEALRTCDAILFILDYTSFKDDINAELFSDLIENRREFLANNTGTIYFILNKIDRKSERDRPIPELIETLKKVLIDFGIPEPIIYQASAWQGLLAKLIQKKEASKEHKADFKKFFLAQYIKEDEDGESYVPKMADIAPIALQDSGIKTIETSVIQTVVQNSGWNLLSDVLAELNKAAQAIQETLITEIRGWEMELEELKRKVEEYRQRSDSARKKVENVKKSVEDQKRILISEFSAGVHVFAESAKNRIEAEIEKLAANLSKKDSSIDEDDNLFSLLGWLRKTKASLFGEDSSNDSYKIRCKDKEEAQEVVKKINEYCTPIIHNFWVDTQDRLVIDGKRIRGNLVERIKENIQAISDELSKYIGNALQVEIATNPIQFPEFKFAGIDEKVQEQQEVYGRIRKERRTKSRCCNSDEVYEVDVHYEETRYVIDLHQILQEIKGKIDEQVARNLKLLKRVIHQQVSEDFRNGEEQIIDYIDRFESLFDQLLKERAKREVKDPKIIANLERQKAELNEYLSELSSLRESLNIWKPASKHH